MKVLWFVNVPMPSVCTRLNRPVPAAGGWLASLLEAMSEVEGLELCVVSLDDSPRAAGLAPAVFVSGGVHFMHLSVCRTATQALADRWRGGPADERVVAACRYAIDAYNPDIVHVHGTETAVGLVQSRCVVPTLVTIQGLLSACAPAYFGPLRPRDVTRDFLSPRLLHGTTLLHAYHSTVRGARRELGILRDARWVSGRTNWDKEMTSRLAPDAHYFHADHVLRQEFRQERWTASQDATALLVHVSTKPYKGLECTLASLAELTARGRAVRLVIVGSSQGSAMRGLAERLAGKWSLRSRIAWTGELPAQGLAALMSNASAYVHSSHVDNSPTTLAEAQALGVPVVAASAGGVSSMIVDHSTGILVPPGDSHAMAAAIAEILDNPALAARMGHEAALDAANRHDANVVRNQTMHAYERMVS